MGNRGERVGGFQGFVATHYDLWFGDAEHSSEYQFYKQIMLKKPGPALELGCGTGRLLLPLLQQGFAVDGVDLSVDMLAICREKATALGLSPQLYEQAMQDLDVPGRYETVLIPGNSFTLLTDRREAMEALRRIYGVLSEEGQLALSLVVPQLDVLTGGNQDMWRVIADRRRSDGDQIILSEKVEVDYWQQLKTNWNKYQVVRDGQVIEAYTDRICLRWYYRYEFEMMLELAGFQTIEIYNSFNRVSGEDPSSMIIHACKAAR